MAGPVFAIHGSAARQAQRHPATVRITHWLTALSFFGLLVSSGAILVAHPRLYWGETGAVGMPSLIDLPIPFKLGHSGWGRYLHFQSAWLLVLAGAWYGVWGVATGHFRRNLTPGRRDLAFGSSGRVLSDRGKRPDPGTYNVVQRLAYLAVLFVLFPLTILTGLAMSPAITSVFPITVAVFGGQQSARTIHFFLAAALTVFLVLHVAMVWLAGFGSRVAGMITGRAGSGKERI